MVIYISGRRCGGPFSIFVQEVNGMKLLRQFLIIAAVALAGEALNALIPLPIPASVYGLVLMQFLVISALFKCRKRFEPNAEQISVCVGGRT